jgi:arginase
MEHKTILTPFFLDERLDGLLDLMGADWALNQPDELPGEKPQQRMARLYERLAEQVAGTLAAGRQPVSIAGDCCTTLGVLAGLQRAEMQPSLIWFDAHGDFNTWMTSPSGFLGGMPLAMLVGRGEQTIVKALGLRPLPEERVTLTDGRDLDPQEALALEGSQVHHLRKVEALLDERLPDGDLYVHFDTDVLDPSAAGAMNYLSPGGASAAQLGAVFEKLADSGRVAAVSMSSWNPVLDTDGSSRKVCMDLLEKLVGERL